MMWKSAAIVAAAVGTTTLGQGFELTARTVIPKTPNALLETPSDFTGRAIVKFTDGVKARVAANGDVMSLGNENLVEVRAILAEHGVSFSSPFRNVPAWKVNTIVQRAQARSGKVQPDLLGIMHLVGDPASVDAAARELNSLGLIEYVEFERPRYAGADSSGTPYPHFGNFEEMKAKELAAQATRGEGVKAWADFENPAHFTPPGATRLNETWDLESFRRSVKDQRDVRLSNEGDGNPAFDLGTGGDGGFEVLPQGVDCGDDMAGNCFEDGGNGSPFCDDAACCDLIGDLDAFCVNVEWDDLCAAQANLLCGMHTDPGDPPADPPEGPNRCAVGFIHQGCFEGGILPGCSDGECCLAVCAVEPFCCNISWDANCIGLAVELCVGDPAVDDPTPSLVEIQGYLNDSPYEIPLPMGFPYDALPIPNDGMVADTGFDGAGIDIFTQGEAFSDWGVDGIDGTGDEGEGNQWWDPGEPFRDDGRDQLPGTMDEGEGDGFWTQPEGLLGFAQQFLFSEGIDEGGNGIRVLGDGYNVAIIEFSIWADHEEFAPLIVDGEILDGRTMIPEPNQRLFETEFIGEPDHGTACAAIVVARDETQFGLEARGVKGLVPNAQGFFYPITSINEGPREMAAWTNAIFDLNPGDVITASYGPGGSNLALSPTMNLMLGIATNAGIIVCVSAGNDCVNLSEDDTELPDSGAIVVGAGSPGNQTIVGRPFRLSFSNYSRTYDNALPSQVHLAGWGTLVTTAGYGDAFRVLAGDGSGVDPNRTYTAQFNGTSAASPIVAGAIVAAQGFHEQYYGFPLTAGNMRNAMGAPGTPQNFPLRLFRGHDEDEGCNLDTAVALPYNNFGLFPRLSNDGFMTTILQQNAYGDAPFTNGVVLVRGDYDYGSEFSIKGLDGEWYVAAAVRTEADAVPGLTPPGGGGGGIGGEDDGLPAAITVLPEIGSARYLLGGNIVDIVARATSPNPDPTEATINIALGPFEIFSVLFIEAYDWGSGRWILTGALTSTAGGGQISLNQPRRHVNPATGEALVRIYSIGFPGFGQFGGPANYRARYDLIEIDFGDGFEN